MLEFSLFFTILVTSFSSGKSLVCYICANSPGSEFSAGFDQCQNVFSPEKSFFPFENNPKCYNGEFCAKFIFTVLDRKVIVRQCISQNAIVNFDPENPPSANQAIRSTFKGYNAEGYFCKSNYCNVSSSKSLTIIALFILPIILQFM